MTWSDRVRARANAVIESLGFAEARSTPRGGVRSWIESLGSLARQANDALGRPLADERELADRRAFAAKPAPGVAAAPGGRAMAPAPVIVYHMDKTRREAEKLTDILNAQSIPHQVANIEDDAAAQAAIRRDSRGMRLPVVFIAGECIGGREQVVNAAATGSLAKKVFG